MGPRPNGRGKVSRSTSSSISAWRQWGRGQTAAESGACRPGLNSWTWRQWGRGQTAAERRGHAKFSRRLRASMGPRPNGRGKVGRRYWGCEVDERVNGAAAKRPRKAAARPAGRGCRPRQWGRGQTAAESVGSVGSVDALPRVNGAAAKRPRKGHELPCDPCKCVASMGPRPNGRGKRVV